jgi:hypothetical protein
MDPAFPRLDDNAALLASCWGGLGVQVALGDGDGCSSSESTAILPSPSREDASNMATESVKPSHYMHFALFALRDA